MKRKTTRKKEHAVKIISDEKLKDPAEIKEIIEKKKFTGYYKTKVRFIN
jgi:hypothetical protein